MGAGRRCARLAATAPHASSSSRQRAPISRGTARAISRSTSSAPRYSAAGARGGASIAASTAHPGRASPGGATAARTRCTRPSRPVTVPSFSAKLAIGSTTVAAPAPASRKRPARPRTPSARAPRARAAPAGITAAGSSATITTPAPRRASRRRPRPARTHGRHAPDACEPAGGSRRRTAARTPAGGPATTPISHAPRRFPRAGRISRGLPSRSEMAGHRRQRREVAGERAAARPPPPTSGATTMAARCGLRVPRRRARHRLAHPGLGDAAAQRVEGRRRRRRSPPCRAGPAATAAATSANVTARSRPGATAIGSAASRVICVATAPIVTSRQPRLDRRGRSRRRPGGGSRRRRPRGGRSPRCPRRRRPSRPGVPPGDVGEAVEQRLVGRRQAGVDVRGLQRAPRQPDREVVLLVGGARGAEHADRPAGAPASRPGCRPPRRAPPPTTPGAAGPSCRTSGSVRRSPHAGASWLPQPRAHSLPRETGCRSLGMTPAGLPSSAMQVETATARAERAGGEDGVHCLPLPTGHPAGVRGSRARRRTLAPGDPVTSFPEACAPRLQPATRQGSGDTPTRGGLQPRTSRRLPLM